MDQLTDREERIHANGVMCGFQMGRLSAITEVMSKPVYSHLDLLKCLMKLVALNNELKGLGGHACNEDDVELFDAAMLEVD